MDKTTGRTDWKRVDHLTDAEIARAVADDPDAAPLGAKGLRMVRRGRPKSELTKQPISIRLSPDVLAYFRSLGKGWQGKIDSILREHMMHHR